MYWFCFRDFSRQRKPLLVRSTGRNSNRKRKTVEEEQEDGSLDSQERELISGAIEFDDCEVADILVPSVNVIAVPTNMAMEKIKSIFLEYNYSRLPVYKDSIDQIVGMIHNIDFFTAIEKGNQTVAFFDYVSNLNANKLLSNSFVKS